MSDHGCVFFSVMSNAACPSKSSLLDAMAGVWQGIGQKVYPEGASPRHVDVDVKAEFVSCTVLKSHSKFIETQVDNGEETAYESIYYVKATNECDGQFRSYVFGDNEQFANPRRGKFDGSELVMIELLPPYTLITESEFPRPGKVDSKTTFLNGDNVVSRTVITYEKISN
ncbi:MAG: hypothetical protein R2827_07765 [Bdellovibrionales bacterium]